MYVLLNPVITLCPGPVPTAVFSLPSTLLKSAIEPTAVLPLAKPTASESLFQSV